MKLTMEEFARLVGVSRATVSRAINDHPRVAPETKERIRAAMEQYQYWPNGLARGLVIKRTGVVGMVTTNIGSPYRAALIQSVYNELHRNRYSTIFSFTGASIEREREALRMLKERQVDGLLVSLLINDHGRFENADLVQRIVSQGTPVVLLDHYLRDSDMDFVVHDLYGGARTAINHLIDLGHRRIGYVGARFYRTSTDGRLSEDGRLEGYRSSLADAGIPFDERLAVQSEHSISGGYDGARKLLEFEDRPTAIFCYTDVLAVGSLRAVHDAGIKVPEEMSIIGCDDSDMASRAEVPLTTLKLAKEELGQQAARILVEKIRAEGLEKTRTRQVVLPTALVVRESTAPCSR